MHATNAWASHLLNTLADRKTMGVWDDTTLNPPRVELSFRRRSRNNSTQTSNRRWNGCVFFCFATETGMIHQAVTNIEDPIGIPPPFYDTIDIESRMKLGRPVPVDPRKYIPGQYISPGYSGHGMSPAFSWYQKPYAIFFRLVLT